jgi:hypothetical protein
VNDLCTCLFGVAGNDGNKILRSEQTFDLCWLLTGEKFSVCNSVDKFSCAETAENNKVNNVVKMIVCFITVDLVSSQTYFHYQAF